MAKIKLCGITRPEDVAVINNIKPEYIGFVFAQKSKRYVTDETARSLKDQLHPDINAVGVFVDEPSVRVAQLLSESIIDLAQLHGHEDEDYIRKLRTMTDKPVIRAFRINNREDLKNTWECSADHVLLDAGAGDGTAFDWSWLKGYERPYFLAGGLDPYNVEEAVRRLHPYAVDVSSGIETGGVKDPDKMRRFVDAVRSI